MKSEQRQLPSYPLRLEPKTRAKLEAIAKANGRSLHAEISMRLDASLQEEEATPADSQSLTVEDVRRLALEVVRAELTKAGK
ncbi:TraY domain-containing protein [Thiothrix lacustris]|uniref:TraY domain-containing protein n=1 Tax=Thiothrix lacustris TaxID=525917 RepID=UPI0027E52522|nr:TraY domain-containing protein [Thiothrix lacustris]WMP16954.1 TraY domain-containing protein [Thiothrix lacustris]